MDFSPLINDYKENDSEVSSPIWIWFQKKEKNDVICQICKTNIQHRDSSTGQMTQHLQRHHNFMKKYNAFKEFKEMTQAPVMKTRVCEMLLKFIISDKFLVTS